jgi:hypothetical protein
MMGDPIGPRQDVIAVLVIVIGVGPGADPFRSLSGSWTSGSWPNFSNKPF